MTIVFIDMEDTDYSERIKDIGKNKNDETDGDIIFVDFNVEKLRYYAHSHLSTPALKHMSEKVLNKFEKIEKKIKALDSKPGISKPYDRIDNAI